MGFCYMSYLQLDLKICLALISSCFSYTYVSEWKKTVLFAVERYILWVLWDMIYTLDSHLLKVYSLKLCILKIDSTIIRNISHKYYSKTINKNKNCLLKIYLEKLMKKFDSKNMDNDNFNECKCLLLFWHSALECICYLNQCIKKIIKNFEEIFDKFDAFAFITDYKSMTNLKLLTKFKINFAVNITVNINKKFVTASKYENAYLFETNFKFGNNFKFETYFKFDKNFNKKIKNLNKIFAFLPYAKLDEHSLIKFCNTKCISTKNYFLSNISKNFNKFCVKSFVVFCNTGYADIIEICFPASLLSQINNFLSWLVKI